MDVYVEGVGVIVDSCNSSLPPSRLPTPPVVFCCYVVCGRLWRGVLQQRVTGLEMEQFKDFEAALNSQHGSSIVTEFPFNGLGILEKVMPPPPPPPVGV